MARELRDFGAGHAMRRRARPWMKFYPADWQSDEVLRSCSLAARGVWIEMLALMHKSERRGHLLVAGKPPTIRQLAILCGATEREMQKAIFELKETTVFDLVEDVIVSRRMVRDAEREERDQENGSLGGNPAVKRGVNPPDNPKDNGGDKAQKLDARPSSDKSSDGGAPKRGRPKQAIPEGWAPSEIDQAYAAKHGFVSGEIGRMAERFANHARQQDRRCADWQAAWRNWVLEERKRNPLKPKVKIW